jgi:hypothetical protein
VRLSRLFERGGRFAGDVRVAQWWRTPFALESDLDALKPILHTDMIGHGVKHDRHWRSEVLVYLDCMHTLPLTEIVSKGG